VTDMVAKELAERFRDEQIEGKLSALIITARK
jgi:hypothetical protein